MAITDSTTKYSTNEPAEQPAEVEGHAGYNSGPPEPTVSEWMPGEWDEAEVVLGADECREYLDLYKGDMPGSSRSSVVQ